MATRFDPKYHHRRSIRLPNYDYRSPGVYFVTICVHQGECLLGEVADGQMLLNELGRVAREFWGSVPGHFASVSVDTFTIMPNHLHAIIEIQPPPKATDSRRRGEVPSPSPPNHLQTRRGRATPPLQPSTLERPTLGQIVAYYQHQTTQTINGLREMPGVPFWQRNYWEHVVRDEDAYNRISRYIHDNPARWEEDQLHPEAAPNPFNRWAPNR